MIKFLKYFMVCIAFVSIFFIDNARAIEHKEVKYTISSLTDENPQVFECTAYDLSYQSCQKDPDHPLFGITASGKSLKNHTRESAMAIAVDPKVIPMGSKVLIVFRDKTREKYSGIYKAVDTGGAIQGKRIDVFFGDFGANISSEAMRFGRVNADVYVLKNK
jgi:3D (Asp-Asp-Asp) domain-containing protein